MRIYLMIGMVCTALLVSSCSGPKPLMFPYPQRICAEGEDPKLDSCVKEKPTSAITIRGYRD